MCRRKLRDYLWKILLGVTSAYALVFILVVSFQRHLLFFPDTTVESSHPPAWSVSGKTLGYVIAQKNPTAVWLFIHGNAGRASKRLYALSHIPKSDSVYILEYPGYGSRAGSPSTESMNSAAEEAYLQLRKQHPEVQIKILGESIGSGPSSHLGSLPIPPDEINLVVPFDKLQEVVKAKFPFFPVHLALLDRWDNTESLRNYHGKLHIYGANDDQVIPVSHARNLAKSLPQSVYSELLCGHNTWAETTVQF